MPSIPPTGCGAARHWRDVFGPASLPYRAPTGRARAAAASCSTSGPGTRRPSHRGFCRDLRRLAEAALGLAAPLSRLAGICASCDFIDRARRGDRRRIARRCAAATRIEDSPRTPAHAGASTTRRSSRATAQPRGVLADELLLQVFSTAPGARELAGGGAAARAMRASLRQRDRRAPGLRATTWCTRCCALIIDRCERCGLYVRGPRRELLRAPALAGRAAGRAL